MNIADHTVSSVTATIVSFVFGCRSSGTDWRTYTPEDVVRPVVELTVADRQGAAERLSGLEVTRAALPDSLVVARAVYIGRLALDLTAEHEVGGSPPCRFR